MSPNFYSNIELSRLTLSKTLTPHPLPHPPPQTANVLLLYNMNDVAIDSMLFIHFSFFWYAGKKHFFYKITINLSEMEEK